MVEDGETIDDIAALLHVPVDILEEANRDVDFDNLEPGQILNIPTRSHIHNYEARAPTTYTVQGGETGQDIAAQLEVPFIILQAANPGVNFHNLQRGQVLNIPVRPDGSLRAREPTTHEVEDGETVTQIAKEVDVPVEILMLANKDVDFDNLEPGQVLNIPVRPDSDISAREPTTHEVEEGETASDIAANLDVPVEVLQMANKDVDLDDLEAGQVLNIPVRSN